MQIRKVDDAIVLLREKALDITNLTSFVSLNMAAIRKILKKISKNIHSDGPHGPGEHPLANSPVQRLVLCMFWGCDSFMHAGLLTLRIEHPHEPGWKVLQVTSHLNS